MDATPHYLTESRVVAIGSQSRHSGHSRDRDTRVDSACVQDQPRFGNINICHDASSLESYSTDRSAGAVRLGLIAVNARCAVRFTAWLLAAAPAALCASAAAVRHAAVPSFQQFEIASGDPLPSRVGLSCQIQ